MPLSFTDVQPAIEAALTEWNTVAHSAITFSLPVLPYTGDETGPVSIIRFDAHWTGGAGYALPAKDPVTERYTSFQIWLHHQVRWSTTSVYQEGALYKNPLATGSCSDIGALDLQTILSHELGHVLGLGHPANGNEALTMTPGGQSVCMGPSLGAESSRSA